jgi:hypothetical protein
VGKTVCDGVNMAVYKTVIRFEVLSESRIPSDMSLEQIARETVEGEWSGHWEVEQELGPLSEEMIILECIGQGTDPEFFGVENREEI